MARVRERVFAFVTAILFLGTSVGISFAVIWEAHQNNNNNSNATTTTANQNQSGSKKGQLLENFTPVSHVDSLTKIDTKAGNGQEAKAGDTVVVNYSGAIASTGVIFDNGDGTSLSLDQVIEGWKDGIPGMKIGGTRRLLIPAAQAYGANPPSGSGIPANADLVFDVTLESIGQ
jgi:FKBP-type peptidyl-prolyl cis-trans isomerase